MVTKRNRSNGRRWTSPSVVLAAAAAFAMLSTLAVSGQRPYREWRDYSGGPDGSRFVDLNQITRSNVTRLDVAWTYPHGVTGFNPIVSRGVVYTRGRANALVGATTTGSPSMYEHAGRQYLLVAAASAGGRGAPPAGTYPTGPTGLVAYALPR